MSNTNTNRPQFRLYTVSGDSKNARWTDIGVPGMISPLNDEIPY